MTTAKSMNRKKLGNMGEEFAARYLTNSGFTILKRNFRSFWGEIDIIAQKHNLFIFCEVKTRTSLLYGRPALSVDNRKQQRIIQTARYFLESSCIDDFDCRFDILEVFSSQGQMKIHHLENAFEVSNC